MTSGWFTHPPASEPSDHTLEPWSLCAVLGSRDVTRAAWRSHHPSVLRLVMFFLQNRLTYPSKVCPQGRQRVNVYHPWMVSDNAKTHLVYLQRGMNQDIYIYTYKYDQICVQVIRHTSTTEYPTVLLSGSLFYMSIIVFSSEVLTGMHSFGQGVQSSRCISTRKQHCNHLHSHSRLLSIYIIYTTVV